MLSDAILQNLFGLMSGLIGAAIGGFFTLYATNKAIRAQYAQEDRQEEKEVQALLDAIGVEMTMLWSFHMQRVGNLIESLNDGEPLQFYYPLTQNYFTIYDENADKLGKIREDELRAAIVRCYNKCKKVVDAFTYNNELYTDWREYNDMYDGSKEQEKLLNAKWKALCEFSTVIREDHNEVKRYAEELSKQLTNRKRHA